MCHGQMALMVPRLKRIKNTQSQKREHTEDTHVPSDRQVGSTAAVAPCCGLKAQRQASFTERCRKQAFSCILFTLSHQFLVNSKSPHLTIIYSLNSY